MALVIEDGTEVSGANSYTTDAEFVAYAAARGYVIPATEALRDPLQVKAMDYLASLEMSYRGYRVTSTQPLSYPRVGVVLNGYYLNSDTIPIELKNAQLELAYQAYTEELLVNQTTSNLTGFEVDGVYSETYSLGGSRTSVSTGKANAYLCNLLVSGNRAVRA